MVLPKFYFTKKNKCLTSKIKIVKFPYQQTMDFLDYFQQLDQENTLQILLQDLLVVVRIVYLQPISKTNDARKSINFCYRFGPTLPILFILPQVHFHRKLNFLHSNHLNQSMKKHQLHYFDEQLS